VSYDCIYKRLCELSFMIQAMAKVAAQGKAKPAEPVPAPAPVEAAPVEAAPVEAAPVEAALAHVEAAESTPVAEIAAKPAKSPKIGFTIWFC